jgi:anaerobic ribonucleoside-triphosphate reductase activating protein
MRIAGIIRESIVDGPGLRFVVFTQGCPHRCPGCHNPETHDIHGGSEMPPCDVVSVFLCEADGNPLLDGVTISGGEPLLQAKELLPLAEAVKDRGLGLWLYTGYTIEEIASRGDRHELELLAKVDALVDGRFVEELRPAGSHEAPFAGSANQRIIEAPILRETLSIRNGI